MFRIKHQQRSPSARPLCERPDSSPASGGAWRGSDYSEKGAPNTVTPMKIGAQFEGHGVLGAGAFWSGTQPYELGPCLRRDDGIQDGQTYSAG